MPTPKHEGLLGKLKQQTHTDNRPPGWYTLDELIKKDPMPKTTARELLTAAITAGLVETKKFKSPIGNGKSAIRVNYKEL